MSEVTVFVCEGRDLLLVLRSMRDIIMSPAIKMYLRRRNRSELYHIARLFITSIQKLSSNPDEIYYDTNNSAKALLGDWDKFSKEEYTKSILYKHRFFITLWERTQSLLNEIVNGVRLGRQSTKEIVRRRTTNDVNEDLKSLGARQKEIRAQIEREKSKGIDANQEVLKSLQKDLEDVSLQREQKSQERIDTKEEQQAENNWDQKIQDAFTQLKECSSSIEEEKKNITEEYNFYYHCFYGVAVLIIVWMLFLYLTIFVHHVNFYSWISFLPYYLPIPLLAALLWVLIVQKNRASKLSITMSEELFRVRYLEGLLLAVNKLSKNSETSISRINKAIDTMVDSYLHQTERLFLNEDKISTIEKKEVSVNKLMQLMDKLVDKV